ncbi:MAG: hypothetical protein KKA84_14590 [Bacteroidetes bacterium]|nr:hypothetical protein [Bacteroidota bacterium]
MIEFLKIIFTKPIELLKWLTNHHPGQLFPTPSTRKDIQRIPIDDNSYLEVFWKILEFGTGPAVSLFINKEEILRIDCSGPGTGHLHAAFFLPWEGEVRLFLPEKTCSLQIERAVFEITHNWNYYHSRVANASVRSVRLNVNKIEDAAKIAGQKMHVLLDTVPELKEKT